MLGTYFLGKLEQKAPKLVADQESSIYNFGRGTLVISVFVYSRTVRSDFVKATNTTTVCQCTIILLGVNICGALTERKKKLILCKSYL